MNGIKSLMIGKAFVVVATGFFVAGLSANAQIVQHLNVTRPGGMPGLPVMNGIVKTTNGVNVMWDGPSGYYRVYQTTNLKAGAWQQAGNPSLARNATITTLYSNAFFRVSGPSPRYAGSQACLECHESIYTIEMHTRHAGAFTNSQFKSFGGQTNSSCLPCHTVGFGLPTGFVNATATPQLAGVQCENCHGPAARHAANDSDLTVRPRVEIAATVCGGCHDVAQHPSYREWKTSGHSVVSEDMNPPDRISACGRCHSGSARLALLKGEVPAVTVTNDANVALGCVTCHDPHQKTAYPHQLRNPLFSTNDFYLKTTDVFANKYNPAVNICAQCHNHRGASSSSTSRPPHHSPQYNILLGTVGELTNGPATFRPATHAFLTNQCVTCHMPTKEFQGESHPAMTGHSFRVEIYDACLDCHMFPEDFVEFTSAYVSDRLKQLKASLDTWATNRAPLALRTKYGALAWEYTTAGDFNPGAAGPDATEQGQIPTTIKKARFNLYLVLNDGSLGIHNGPFSITLLDAAANWVQQEPASDQ